MHYEFEGQAHKRVILLSRGSTKEWLSELGFKGWEESGTTDGGGGEGVSSGGVGKEAKAMRRECT